MVRQAVNFFNEYVISEFFKSPELESFKINLGNFTDIPVKKEIAFYDSNGIKSINRGEKSNC